MRFNVWLVAAAVAIVCATSPSTSEAAVVVHGTRVIYPASENEVTVRLENSGNLPVLVQSWLDRGDIRATPEEADVPFLLSPAIFHLKPKAHQNIRVVKLDNNLSRRNEEVFWLNVLEIPPKTADASAVNRMHVSLRTRIKLIYRPEGLTSEGAREAPNALRWSLIHTASGQLALQADNPTPYYVHLPYIALKNGGQAIRHPSIGIAKPNARSTFNLPNTDASVSTGEVELIYVTDFGNEQRLTVAKRSGDGSERVAARVWER